MNALTLVMEARAWFIRVAADGDSVHSERRRGGLEGIWSLLGEGDGGEGQGPGMGSCEDERVMQGS